MRTLFQKGCLDFIQLQQINYRLSFRCLHGCDNMTADGITLGFHCAHMFLQRPCAAPPASPPVLGSLPGDRLLLPACGQRDLLLQFAGDGCTPAELAALKDSICRLPPQAGGRALLPFLVAGPGSSPEVKKPPEHYRKFLYSVGTTAPECVLLPTAVVPAVEELVRQGAMSLQHTLLLAQRAPVLHQFLKPALQQNQGGHLQNVKSLLRELLTVCREEPDVFPLSLSESVT